MKRPTGSFIHPKSGYTLVEILTATVLTLVMMSGVVTIFGRVSQAISNSRSSLEMMDRLRAAQRTLQRDLGQVTVTMLPPRRPESAEGYFEYVEGPVGPINKPYEVATNTMIDDDPARIDDLYDTTAGDSDDLLMFTVRSPGQPFIGRHGLPGGASGVTWEAVESQVAEVTWFLRGRTLYRRVLLVLPNIDLSNATQDGFYASNDLSVYYDSGSSALLANTLGDLTMPHRRFGHDPDADNVFPSHPHNVAPWDTLKLPTLRECSYINAIPANSWIAGAALPTPLSAPPLSLSARGSFDPWQNPYPWQELDQMTGTLTAYPGDRIGEDVILTNVLGFDVKAWDPDAPVLRAVSDANPATPNTLSDDTSLANIVVVPGDPGYGLALAHLQNELAKAVGSRDPDYLPLSYGAYVDLNYGTASNSYGAGVRWTDTDLAGRGDARSRLNFSGGPYVYDTWSFHYEHDGLSQDDNDGDGNFPNDSDDPDDEGTNGFDDNGDGIVDDIDEFETSPPYPVPLRGIQVKIRVFEPDSRQVREVTVVQDFLPK